MSMKRKKWTEEEERTLIDKYAAMVADGSLQKLRTREKKFRPIAGHVNSVHHHRDPAGYPFQWSWKDACTKVQNMRHQYLLVKQKIKRLVATVSSSGSAAAAEEFDWEDGLSHWPNFLRYKEVFGDVELGSVDSPGHRRLTGAARIGVPGSVGDGGFGVTFDIGENGVLGFEYDGEEGDGDDGFEYEDARVAGTNGRMSRKKRKRLLEQRAAFVSAQLGELKQWEARSESQEVERERERQRREEYRAELEESREKEREEREREREEVRREWACELDSMEKEWAERERQRREEAAAWEQEWEDRMDRKRLEWRKRIDGMMNQHRASMDSIQSRIIHEQQNIVNQLLGLVSQWTGQSPGLPDHTTGPYLSQMMQNLHHVNGMVHGENRVGGDNHDDQFIVDG
ncbi:hypothetical protein ACLOJK_008097 [Asimina triloba]